MKPFLYEVFTFVRLPDLRGDLLLLSGANREVGLVVLNGLSLKNLEHFEVINPSLMGLAIHRTNISNMRSFFGSIRSIRYLPLQRILSG
jgi:hypothetical protein